MLFKQLSILFADQLSEHVAFWVRPCLKYKTGWIYCKFCRKYKT